jgi:Cytochrome c.
LFADNCGVCHGPQGEGGAGSDLRPFAPADASLAAAIADTINSGGGGMPSFSGRFDGGQLDALVAYLLGL